MIARLGCLLWSHVWHLVASRRRPQETAIAVGSRWELDRVVRSGETWRCDKCGSEVRR